MHQILSQGPCDDKYKQGNTNSTPRVADIFNGHQSNQSNTEILATLLQTLTSTYKIPLLLFMYFQYFPLKK